MTSYVTCHLFRILHKGLEARVVLWPECRREGQLGCMRAEAERQDSCPYLVGNFQLSKKMNKKA